MPTTMPDSVTPNPDCNQNNELLHTCPPVGLHLPLNDMKRQPHNLLGPADGLGLKFMNAMDTIFDSSFQEYTEHYYKQSIILSCFAEFFKQHPTIGANKVIEAFNGNLLGVLNQKQRNLLRILRAATSSPFFNEMTTASQECATFVMYVNQGDWNVFADGNYVVVNVLYKDGNLHYEAYTHMQVGKQDGEDSDFLRYADCQFTQGDANSAEKPTSADKIAAENRMLATLRAFAGGKCGEGIKEADSLLIDREADFVATIPSHLEEQFKHFF